MTKKIKLKMKQFILDALLYSDTLSFLGDSRGSNVGIKKSLIIQSVDYTLGCTMLIVHPKRTYHLYKRTRTFFNNFSTLKKNT